MRCCRIMLAVFVSASLMGPCAAGAVPAGAPVVLAFGATYARPDGATAVHRGVDVACDEGDAVTSLLDGEVSFVGRVPSAAGGTMLAVSVRAGDDVVTLSPLDSAVVVKGDAVHRGQILGTVAAEGDPSSPAPHVHVSFRRQGAYLDPAPLLPAAAVSESPQALGGAADAGTITSPAPREVASELVVSGPQPAPVPVASPAPALAPVPAPAPAVSPAPVGAPLAPTLESPGMEQAASSADAGESRESVNVPVRAGAGLPAFVTEGPGAIPAAAGASAFTPVRRVSPLAGALSSVQRWLGGPARNAQDVQPLAGFDTATTAPLTRDRPARASSPSTKHATTVPRRVASPLAAAALVAALLAAGLLLTRRVVERRIQSNPPVSHRLGMMLQHLRAGDTLCGLTSCSGLLPSQSRGRLAQRR